MSIRIVIGCRSHLLSEGLRKLLQDDRDLETIGIFTEGTDFEEIVKVKADIILIDYGIFMSLPEDFAVDEQSKILLLDTGITTFPIREIPEMVSRGVVGILPPSTDSELLKKALKAVSSGDLWINHKTIKNIFSSKKFPEKKAPLTKMEREIMACICQGYRNKEIAQKFDISEKTVRSHCNRIYNKFGVSDRIQLVIYCFKIGYMKSTN